MLGTLLSYEYPDECNCTIIEQNNNQTCSDITIVICSIVSFATALITSKYGKTILQKIPCCAKLKCLQDEKETPVENKANEPAESEANVDF